MHKFGHVAKRCVVPLVVVIVLCAVGAVWTTPNTGAAANQARVASSGFTVRIGDAVPLTGGNATYGPAYAKAAGLAVKVADLALKQAGVEGIRIAIQHVDSGSDPTSAVTAARKLIGDGASCIVGTLSSNDTQAITVGAAGPAGIPLISPSSSSDSLAALAPLGLFRISPPTSIQAPILAQAVRDAVGSNKKLSIFGTNNSFGAGYSSAFDTAWQRLHGQVQGPTLVNTGQSSYDSEAQKIVSNKPDGFMVSNMFAPDFATLAGALLRTGAYSASRTFLGGGWPSTIPSVIPQEALDGARGIRPDLPSNGVANAFDALWKKTKGASERQTLDANNFDASMMCILGAIAANSANGKSIAGQLRRVSNPPGKQYTYLQLSQAIRALRAGKDINYQGVSGPIDFGANGGARGGTYDWFEYVGATTKILKQYTWAGGKISIRTVS